jgi:TRAP-type C4-dicarboxylate transport system permease small subunit
MNARVLAAVAATAGRRINRLVEWICALLVGAMVAIVAVGVVGRYATEGGVPWAEEAARYVMIWAALLAVSCGAWWREHIGLDLLHARLPQQARVALRIAVDGVCVAFFAFMAVAGVDMTVEGATQFSTLFGLSMQLPFAAVPVSSALAAFQFLARLLADLAAPNVQAAR